MTMGPEPFAGLYAVLIDDAQSTEILEPLRWIIVGGKREMMVGLQLQ